MKIVVVICVTIVVIVLMVSVYNLIKEGMKKW